MPTLRSLVRRVLGTKKRPVILMYHRVADLDCDPWGLAVSPAHFAEQLGVLVRHRRPLALDDFFAHLRAGSLPADAVALTFDDGYADVLEHARPALVAAGVPATLFLATAGIAAPQGFWWDELARLLLQGTQARSLHLPTPGLESFDLGPPEPDDGDPRWRAWEPARTRRQHAFVLAHAFLKGLDPVAIEPLLAPLRDALGTSPVHDVDRIMTAGEVRQLVAGGIFVLGGHTANHANLPAVSPERQHEEISAGKAATEALAGAPVAGFAYPYGGTCEQSRAAVRDCGFRFACTTDASAPMTRSSDPFALPRWAVADTDGAAFRQALSRHAG